jgi:squalene-hopene/tetraprenyl-beta-curcumene cyclase
MKRTIASWILILGAMALLHTEASAADELAAKKEESIKKGLEWLASIQKKNGSWSNEGFPALTGLPLRALIRGKGKVHADAIKRAEAFILKHVQKDGGIYRKSLIPGRGGLSTFNTAICMTALYELQKPGHVRLVQNARTFLSSSQLSGDEDAGGFGYSGPGWFSSADMMNTSYALEAMKITEKVEDLRPDGEKRVDVKWADALAFLESIQNDKTTGEDAGGFIYKPGKSAAGTRKGSDDKVVFRSYGTMTYLGVLSMMYADLGKDDHRVRSALDWAQNHWTIEENPGLGNQGMFFFYHVMTRALAAASVDSIKRKDGKEDVKWKREVAERIIGLQREDGSWVNENGRYWEADPVLVTSYCLLALDLM